MSFGFPLGLLALLALAPLAAAYFLRRRQKPRVVSAIFLWRSPSQRAQAGPRLERFSRELSMLLEALAVLVAALFLADLRFDGEAPRRHLVVVVDGSLSLSARPPGRKPIAARVREAAAEAVAVEQAGLVTIVESGIHPRVLAGPQLEAGKALAALEAWSPRGAAHDLVPALLLGRELAGDGQRLWFITDGPVPEGLAVPKEVSWVAVGERLENLALVAAQRRDEGGIGQVTVRVASFATAPVTAEVSFTGPPGEKKERVTLAPGATAVVRASFPGEGPIEVRLPDDPLPDDGQVTLLPSPTPPVRVAVLPGLGPAEEAAIRRLLEIVPGASLVAPETGAALSFGPRGSPARVQLGAPGEQRSFVGPFFAQRGHPLLEDVGFGGVLWTAGGNPPGRPLVSAGDSVLLAEEEDGSVHLNLELARSNMQRTPAWPILVGNLLRRGRQSHPGFPRHQLMLGEELEVVTGPGARFVITGPDGVRPVVGSGAVRLPAPSGPGSYQLLRDGEEIDRLEVLSIDPRESDLRDRASLTVPAPAGGELAVRALTRGRPVWPVVLLLALLLADFALTARSPR